jgi:hypothetical protein
MKSILDQMEEHIAAIRNLQRNFDFHSKRLERLMRELSVNHSGQVENTPMGEKATELSMSGTVKMQNDR